jgi:hypothetical protein
MKQVRAPGAAQEKARRVLLHLVGGGDFKALLAVLALLVSLGWFTDSLFEWLTDLGLAVRGGAETDWLAPHRFFGLAVFPLLAAWFWWLARGARARYRPRVARDHEPPYAKGLVLFLSNLKPEHRADLEAELGAIASMDDFRNSVGGLNWRMPLEAIAYHRGRLAEVVVICSRPGSAEQLALFRRTLGRVFPEADFAVTDGAALAEAFRGELSFDDVELVSQITDEAVQRLLDRGLAIGDILIDITGGTKPTAVAATAVALAEGRHIQYVSGDPKKTDPYQVTVYDVTYDQ